MKTTSRLFTQPSSLGIFSKKRQLNTVCQGALSCLEGEVHVLGMWHLLSKLDSFVFNLL